MKAVAAVTLSLLAAVVASPAAAQGWGYPDQSRTWSSRGGYGHDFNGQADRPGDYRCDAYWDRGRDDCGAAWRDQRPFVRHSSAGYGYGSGYTDGRGANSGHAAPPGYGYGHGGGYGRGYRSGSSGGYVYQPYSQGTQYYGAYGRPDQVYPGGGYGGHYGAPYGGYTTGQIGGGRDPGRSAWCASRYRSYDPYSGYYRAYSGRLVFCG
jgi:hypothetical protein